MEYTLPIPCRRTSDARELTPSGKYNNVIVFACRSHDVPSATEAIRAHMKVNGHTISEKSENGAAKSIVVRKPGSYTTTIRVSPDNKNASDPRSIVRVQWFSKD